jgi:hypothetical protein
MNGLDEKKPVYFQTVTDTNMKQLENIKESKLSLATLIATHHPRVALRLLSKENGVSSAKGTL